MSDGKIVDSLFENSKINGNSDHVLAKWFGKRTAESEEDGSQKRLKTGNNSLIPIPVQWKIPEQAIDIVSKHFGSGRSYEPKSLGTKREKDNW
jgi:hypothetical protein